MTKTQLIAALYTAVRAKRWARAWRIARALDAYAAGWYWILDPHTGEPMAWTRNKRHLLHVLDYWIAHGLDPDAPRGRPRLQIGDTPEEVETRISAMMRRTGWGRTVCIAELAATHYLCSPRAINNILRKK